MAKKKWKSATTNIENSILVSAAWLSLRGKATQVFMLFLQRRKMYENKRTKEWFCLNCQELTLTYDEVKQLGLTRREFTYAIDALIANGLIDIVEYGNALARKPTVYGISERWRKFGTPEFKTAEREKVYQGFCKKERPDVAKKWERHRQKKPCSMAYL